MPPDEHSRHRSHAEQRALRAARGETTLTERQWVFLVGVAVGVLIGAGGYALLAMIG